MKYPITLIMVLVALGCATAPITNDGGHNPTGGIQEAKSVVSEAAGKLPIFADRIDSTVGVLDIAGAVHDATNEVRGVAGDLNGIDGVLARAAADAGKQAAEIAKWKTQAQEERARADDEIHQWLVRAAVLSGLGVVGFIIYTIVTKDLKIGAVGVVSSIAAMGTFTALAKWLNWIAGGSMVLLALGLVWLAIWAWRRGYFFPHNDLDILKFVHQKDADKALTLWRSTPAGERQYQFYLKQSAKQPQP